MPPFRLLTQAEIDVLRFLAMRGAHARPVTLPRRMRPAATALWRLELVEVWHRMVQFDQPQPISLYFGLSVAGWHRSQPFLAAAQRPSASRRAAAAARTSSLTHRRSP